MYLNKIRVDQGRVVMLFDCVCCLFPSTCIFFQISVHELIIDEWHFEVSLRLSVDNVERT